MTGIGHLYISEKNDNITISSEVLRVEFYLIAAKVINNLFNYMKDTGMPLSAPDSCND